MSVWFVLQNRYSWHKAVKWSDKQSFPHGILNNKRPLCGHHYGSISLLWINIVRCFVLLVGATNEHVEWYWCCLRGHYFDPVFNPSNAEFNPICHLLALLGAHHILHVSRVRVKNCTNEDHSAHSSLMTDLRLSEPNDCIFFLGCWMA